MYKNFHTPPWVATKYINMNTFANLWTKQSNVGQRYCEHYIIIHNTDKMVLLVGDLTGNNSYT